MLTNHSTSFFGGGSKSLFFAYWLHSRREYSVFKGGHHSFFALFLKAIYWPLLLAKLMVGGELFAQTPSLAQIGNNEGLSQGFVTCIKQDREGFLWAGTLSGLNRYDGHRIHVFKHDPFDEYSLSGDLISAIAEVGDYLLVGTLGGGLNIFCKKNHRFYRIPFLMPSQSPSPSKEGIVLKKYPAENVVNDIVMDGQGGIWLKASNEGHDYQGWVVRMMVPSGFWENLPNDPKLLDKILFQVWWMPRWEYYPFWPSKVASHGNELYCFQMDGLLRFDFAQQRWVCQADLPTGVISNIKWLGKGGEKLVQTPDFSTYFINNAGEYKYVGKLNGYIIHLNGQDFWIREQDHLANYKLVSRAPIFKLSSEGASVKLPMKDKRTVMCTDRSGNLWFTDETSGLLKYCPHQSGFRHLLKGSSIMSRPFMTPKGCLYFSRIPETDLVGPEDLGLKSLVAFGKKNHYHAFTLNMDRLGNYWQVAYHGPTKNAYLIKQEANSTKTTVFPVAGLKGTCQYADFDEKGKLWFTVDGYLVGFDPAKAESKGSGNPWEFYEFKSQAKIGGSALFLEKTPDGVWWMATYNGLIRAEPCNDGYDFRVFRNDPNDRGSLHINYVNVLLNDPLDPNLLWISTKGGGLGCMNLTTFKVKTLTTADGLPDNVLYGLLSDFKMNPDSCNYNLWFSTNKGVVKYAPSTGRIKIFGKSDGLQDDEFNSHAYAYTDSYRKTGELMFGGVNGLNIFDPNKLADNKTPPFVYITGLKLNDRRILAGDSSNLLPLAIEVTKQITVPYSQNSISLDFAALEYTSPSKNMFRYWLKGFEKEGAHTSREPSANYIGLPPGRYQFVVYGSNNDGVWSQEPARLTIHVLPPWYRTKWAYLCYSLILLAFLGWVYHHIQLWLRQKNALHQLEISKVKLDDFAHLLLEKSRLIEELQSNKWHTEHQAYLAHLTITENSHAQLQEVNYELGEQEEEDLTAPLKEMQILTKEDWENFLVMFEGANPGYLIELANRFPNLTAAETRLILLTKIGLAKKEIADMLGVSPDTVKKTRYRLRKKLGVQGQLMEELFPSD